MRTQINRRLLVVWVGLSAITLLYVWIDDAGSDDSARTGSTVVTVSTIGLALLKVRVIMGEFMEVRGAPRGLRYLANLWIVIMAGALLGCYFAGRAMA